MNHGELQTRLGTLLKVKTKRYPLTTRTENLNEAIRDLDDRFESWFAEESTSWDTVDGTGEYAIATQFATPYLEFVAPIDVYYINAEGAEVPLSQKTLEELVEQYPSDTAEGGPKVFTIWKKHIHIRPVPDAVYTLEWKYMGKKRPLVAPGDSNDWTNDEPYAVLYGAAVYGCIELLEESRAATYAKMVEEKITNISIRQSRRMSAVRPVSEEPGATTGV